MEKCKTKSNQTDLSIFKHITAYSGIIQAYSEPCITLSYSELWYIKNPGIFKTIGIFRTLVYSKFWHILNQKPGIFRIQDIIRTLSNIYDGNL